MSSHRDDGHAEANPFVAAKVDLPDTPKFRWRLLPCFFLAGYGIPLAIGPIVLSITIVYLEEMRGKDMRVFHRMEYWGIAMFMACLAGVSLLAACRFVWRSSWTRGIAMILMAAVFGGLFFLISGGLRPAR